MQIPQIMLVEDERIVAMHLRTRLEKLGYNVPAVATSGAQALSQIEAVRPDLILMDIHIDGQMDGIDTAAAIPPDYHIPVIYLTAYSEEATLARARATRPYGYLIKPFSERELHSTIQMTLERSIAEAALRVSEERLRQAHKLEAVGSLTGRMAHDFNNLLAVITLGLGFVVSRMEPADRLRPFIEEALDAANRGADLIRSLLAFARRQALHPANIDVNARLTSLGSLMSRMLGEDIAIVLELETGVWPVNADPAQFESSIINFVTNARDAMPRGGTLTITTANRSVGAQFAGANPPLAPGDYVSISVSDNGIGMTEDILAKIFDPFFSTKAPSKGSGLGLSGVFGFVSQSGGQISARSQPGKGTTIELFLPRLMENATESTSTAVLDRPSGRPQGAGEVILVVEDNMTVRGMVVRQLEAVGYKTLEAENAKKALAILQADKDVDLLFSDIVMPGGIDGFDLAAQVREEYPKVGILLASGFTGGSIQDRLVSDLSSVQLLHKPFDPDSLAIAVRRALEERLTIGSARS